MKAVTDYRQANGSYDYDQVIVDAFSGDMIRFETFLAKKLNCSIDGTPAPALPDPYEALYQQVYTLQLQWVEAHLPQLRREHKDKYGFYPIVVVGEEN
jgi:hypothetical protein